MIYVACAFAWLVIGASSSALYVSYQGITNGDEWFGVFVGTVFGLLTPIVLGCMLVGERLRELKETSHDDE